MKNKKTISYSTEDAAKYGINEAIVLDDLRMWLRYNKKKNKAIQDGRVWTYGSKESICARLPGLSYKAVSKALDKLAKNDVVVRSRYNLVKYDRTYWYSINEDEFYVEQIGIHDVPKRDNALAQKGNETISPKGTMHYPKRANGIGQKGRPIHRYNNKGVIYKKLNTSIPGGRENENKPLIGDPSTTTKPKNGKLRASRVCAARTGEDNFLTPASSDANHEEKDMKPAKAKSLGLLPNKIPITHEMVAEAIWLLRDILPADCKESFAKPPTRELVRKVLLAYTPDQLISIVTSYKALLRTSQYTPRYYNVFSFFKNIDNIRDYVNQSELKASRYFLQDGTKPSDEEIFMFHNYGLMSWNPTPLLDAVVDDLLRTQSDNPLVVGVTRAQLRKYLYLGAVTASIHNAEKTEETMRAAYKSTIKFGLGDILASGQWPLNWQTRRAETMWETPKEDIVDGPLPAELPVSDKEI